MKRTPVAVGVCPHNGWFILGAQRSVIEGLTLGSGKG